MRIHLYFLAFFCLLVNEIGISQVTDPAIYQQIDELLFKEERGNKPGYIVTIVQNDSVIYQRSTGMINVRKKIPIDDHSRFAIASVSKQFTALAIQFLVEEGKISLEDDVHKYIPELPRYPFVIRVKHLLSHTSGIRDHITILGWENNQLSHFYHFDGMLNVLKNYCWTSFPAGENFAYSNTGYMLLALIVQRVSDQPFEEFMQERIFQPLHMIETEFSFRRKGEEYNHSTPYKYLKGSKRFVGSKIREVNALGATGVYTTVSDLLKWDKNFYHHSIGSDETYYRLEEIDTLNDGSELYYNNGLKHRFVGDFRVIEHSGGWANYNIQYTRIPDLHTSIIVACNNAFDYPVEMAEEILDLIIPERYTPDPESSINQEVTGLPSGIYLSDNMILKKVQSINGKLAISDGLPGEHPPYYFVPNESGTYYDKEFMLFEPRDSSFLWMGGTYFNTPKKYTLLREDLSIDHSISEGKYINCELGHIRVKYNSYNESYTLIGSLIKRIKFKSIAPLTYYSKKKDCMIHFIDSYTFNLGNKRVFDLEFKQIDK